MAELSDETLMALADGELEPAERAKIEAQLDRDPALQARFAVFQGTNRAVLAQKFRAPVEAPLPDDLVKLVMTAPSATVRARGSVSQPRRPGLVDGMRSLAAGIVPGWSAAAAYACVAVMAGYAGWSLNEPASRTPATTQVVTPAKHPGAVARQILSVEHGRVIADGVLHRALDTALSATKVEAGAGEAVATVMPRLVYRNANNEFCRPYYVNLDETTGFAGVGCRGDDGRWQLQVHMPAVKPASAGDRAVPAAGEAAILAFINRTRDGDPLGAAEEKAALEAEWKR